MEENYMWLKIQDKDLFKKFCVNITKELLTNQTYLEQYLLLVMNYRSKNNRILELTKGEEFNLYLIIGETPRADEKYEIGKYYYGDKIVIYEDKIKEVL